MHRTNLKEQFARLQAALKKVGHLPTTHVHDDPVFPVRYEFVNMYTASSYTGFWIVRITLNLLLNELARDPEKAPMYLVENREAARDCCQSYTYMARSSFLGPFFMVYALRMSLHGLEEEVQREWVIQKLDELGRSRLALAKKPMPLGPNRHGLPKIRQVMKEIDDLADGC